METEGGGGVVDKEMAWGKWQEKDNRAEETEGDSEEEEKGADRDKKQKCGDTR